MAAQRYLDEAKRYQAQVQDFRTKVTKSPRGKRSEDVEFDDTRDKVRSANERYQNLKHNCEALLSKLKNAEDKQAIYQENKDKLEEWLDTAEVKVQELRKEPVGTEPNMVQSQLDEVKAFSTEVFGQIKKIEDLKRQAKQFAESMGDVGSDDDTLYEIEKSVTRLARRHADLTDDLNARTNVLQTALVQSQDVHEGVAGLLSWLKDTEQSLNNLRPISLADETLQDQIQEVQMMRSDVDSHQPSINTVNKSIDSSDPNTSKAMLDQLKDLNTRFNDVSDRCKEREKDQKDVSSKLNDFRDHIQAFNDWVAPTLETLESKEMAQLDTPQYKAKVNDIRAEAEEKVQDLEYIKAIGQELIKNPKTGDVSGVKEAMAECERNWHDFNEVLDDKEQEATQREEQSNRYAEVYAEVVQWLCNTEGTVDALEPVAVDIEIIEKQIEELQVSRMAQNECVIRCI